VVGDEKCLCLVPTSTENLRIIKKSFFPPINFVKKWSDTELLLALPSVALTPAVCEAFGAEEPVCVGRCYLFISVFLE